MDELKPLKSQQQSAKGAFQQPIHIFDVGFTRKSRTEGSLITQGHRKNSVNHIPRRAMPAVSNSAVALERGAIPGQTVRPGRDTTVLKCFWSRSRSSHRATIDRRSRMPIRFIQELCQNLHNESIQLSTDQ
jgi:hypothetical protein